MSDDHRTTPGAGGAGHISGVGFAPFNDAPKPAMTIPEQAVGQARKKAFDIIGRHPDCIRDDVVLNDLIDDIATSLVGVERAAPPLRAREEIAEINERIESWHNDERTLYPDCEVLEFCDLVERALSSTAGQEWRDINLAREAFQRIIDFPYVGVEASHAIISIARGGLTSLSAPPVAEPIVAEKQTERRDG